jgi:hypothetical protein
MLEAGKGPYYFVGFPEKRVFFLALELVDVVLAKEIHVFCNQGQHSHL